MTVATTPEFGAARVVRADVRLRDGYDYRRCRDECVARGVRHRIARRGVEAKNRLGTHRGTVERTLAWLARYRRLTIRYDQLVEVHRGFLHLACAQICWNYVQQL